MATGEAVLALPPPLAADSQLSLAVALRLWEDGGWCLQRLCQTPDHHFQVTKEVYCFPSAYFLSCFLRVSLACTLALFFVQIFTKTNALVFLPSWPLSHLRNPIWLNLEVQLNPCGVLILPYFHRFFCRVRT